MGLIQKHNFCFDVNRRFESLHFTCLVRLAPPHLLLHDAVQLPRDAVVVQDGVLLLVGSFAIVRRVEGVGACSRLHNIEKRLYNLAKKVIHIVSFIWLP